MSQRLDHVNVRLKQAVGLESRRSVDQRFREDRRRVHRYFHIVKRLAIVDDDHPASEFDSKTKVIEAVLVHLDYDRDRGGGQIDLTLT